MLFLLRICLITLALCAPGLVLADNEAYQGPKHLAIKGAGSYEAPMPVQLLTDPDLCAYLPCATVLPGASRYSSRKGRQSYAEAFQDEHGQQKLLGYVFLSTDIVDIPAYSGKPVVTLIGMDVTGKIVGVKILKHSEPILLAGIPESELTKFVKQFVGK